MERTVESSCSSCPRFLCSPEDARNPISHLGLEWGFPLSIAVQTTASEVANTVQ
jgi:hypothetical protein